MVISEETPHLLHANTFPFILQAVSWWRAELNRMGTPVGYYLQQDLKRLPESVRMIVLPNAYALAGQERAWLDEFMNAGGMVVWTWAPDIYGPDGADPARIPDCVGMPVRAVFDDEPMVIQSVPTYERVEVDRHSWQPRFVIEPQPSLQTIARYAESGEALAAMRPEGEGHCVYTAMPRLPVGLMRWLCEKAGVHLYRNTANMTAVVGNRLMVHTHGEGSHTFSWPGATEVERIYPPGGAMAVKDGRWQDWLPTHTTAMYRCD